MRVFHHVQLKHGHENAEMQKQFDDVTLQYTIDVMHTRLRVSFLLIQTHKLTVKLFTKFVEKVQHQHAFEVMLHGNFIQAGSIGTIDQHVSTWYNNNNTNIYNAPLPEDTKRRKT